MNILVIGLGSMGKRRVRLLRKRADVEQIAGVDSSPERRAEAEALFGIPTAGSVTEALADAPSDCAFVCTSPLSHSAIIQDCLHCGMHVFTEINLVADRYEENMALADKMGKTLFLSSTFLYREEIRYIRKKVAEESLPVHYIYHVGQYLPDWHPWEAYTGFFVGDRRTNGCREILAIELPWIVEIFGEIASVAAVHDRMSTLHVDYDDNYMIQVIHKNGNKGILVIDVVSRKAVRNLDAYSENLYLSWDGTPQGLYDLDLRTKAWKAVSLYSEVEHMDGYQATVIENAYANEIDDFFAVVNVREKAIYGFEKDRVILQWLDRIEGIA